MMKALFYTYSPSKSNGIYSLSTGRVYSSLQNIWNEANANGIPTDNWKSALVTVRLVKEGWTQNGADPNFSTIKVIPSALLSYSPSQVWVGIIAVVLIGFFAWKKYGKR